MGVRRTRISARVEHDRGVFMISVAAELAEMHPQTLRMYEARGLIEPKRSPKGTRLYSQADVERLRRIQEMTTEWGMNLAGVEKVFELEEQLISGRLEVKDLPEAWNTRFQELMGIPVPSDALGVLQDSHWSDGSFGYFPTYLLGSVLSVQIWDVLRASVPDPVWA